MFKLLLQEEILQRIAFLWWTLISKIYTREQMLLKAAQIFWSVTTNRFSDKKQRHFFLNLVTEGVEVITGHLIVKSRIRSHECWFN